MSDPKTLAPEIHRQVVEWDRDVRCLPSFEAMRDLEYFRQLGTHNMLTDDIVRGMYDIGLYAGALWVNECRESRRSWQTMMKIAETDVDFITKHGLRSTWITPAVRKTYKRTCATNQIELKQREIERLQAECVKLKRRASRGLDR